ncbi:MAG: phage scaffolding protein [Lachnospiraceae bacterium]|nr:phage scaffolding protein [Lachnospiraceae bacterium]
MKREDLTAKGLTQEQIDFVMAEHGKELNPVIAERDGYKTQLGEAQRSLESLKGVDVQALQGKITDLTNQLAGKDAEINQVKADAQFNELLKEAIRSAGARSEKAVIPFLDIPALKKSKNQSDDIKAALESVKKDNDFLFQPAQNHPKVVSGTPGINQNAEDRKAQANEALRSLFGKE